MVRAADVSGEDVLDAHAAAAADLVRSMSPIVEQCDQVRYERRAGGLERERPLTRGVDAVGELSCGRLPRVRFGRATWGADGVTAAGDLAAVAGSAPTVVRLRGFVDWWA
jgi:hypothetical protein